MKYKLQLILTALGILLTTVCHAQTAGVVTSTHITPSRNGSVVEVLVQLPNKHFVRLACPAGSSTCLMPLTGAAIETLRFDEYKFYQGTNVALICNGKVGFYVLLGSF